MAEIKYIKFADILKEVEDWKYVELKTDESRVYYKVRDTQMNNGFDFKQIRLISYKHEENWIDMEADCEILLHGTAYFDGVRHLHFGDERSDNEGYFYYPCFLCIEEAFNILKDLELKHCPQKD